MSNCTSPPSGHPRLGRAVSDPFKHVTVEFETTDSERQANSHDSPSASRGLQLIDKKRAGSTSEQFNGVVGVGGTVGRTVGGAVGTVGRTVGGTVGAPVAGTVGRIVGGTVAGTLGGIVGGTVGSMVGGRVGGTVGGRVGAGVGGTVRQKC